MIITLPTHVAILFFFMPFNVKLQALAHFTLNTLAYISLPRIQYLFKVLVLINLNLIKCPNLNCAIQYVLTNANTCVIQIPVEDTDYQPRKFSHTPFHFIPTLTRPQEAKQLLWFFFYHGIVLPVLELHINRIVQDVLFCVRLRLLSIMFLKLTHFVCINVSFLWKAD